MFSILFCLTIILVFVVFKKKHSYWIERGVAQDLAVPFFGINWKILTHQASEKEIFQYLYKKHSKKRYIGVYDFLSPLLIIKDPDLLQQILIKDFEHFLDHRPSLSPDIDPLWNKNVINMKGNKWKEMRSSLSPAFTSHKMRHMFTLMEEVSNNFIQYFLLEDEDVIEVEIRETFSRYINDVIASTCFGYKCDSMRETDNEFYRRGVEGTYNMGFWRHSKMSLLRVFPWMSKVIKVTKFPEDVNEFFREVVKENVEYRQKNNLRRPDMITLLMEAKNELENSCDEEANVDTFSINEVDGGYAKKKQDVSVDDIASNALVFFFAGFTTTVSLLSFMTYELAVNPDIQKILLEEVDRFRRKEKKLSYEDLTEFSYMHMVISETLRKYPAFCRTDRQCSKSFRVQPQLDSEQAFIIECGSSVWIPIYALHHDDKYWPDPEKFQPERFSPLNKKNIKTGTYLPFGIGPRGCLGYRFVLQAVKIIFYELLSRFEIIPLDKTAIPCRFSENTSHIIPGSGFWFGFKRREPLTE